MARPPSNAPVLYDVTCESSMIKQRKDGGYKLVMKNVEKVHWIIEGAEGKLPQDIDNMDDMVDLTSGATESATP